jgi:glucosamine--fructose-6-phosphate aminotransferase (isomerizing)
MLRNMQSELIIDQMKTLGDLHRESFREIDRSVRKGLSALEVESLHRVYAFGDGDSYHSTLSTEMAFNEFAQILYRPLPAMRFLEYGADYIPVNFPRDTLVVGISASGGTTRVAQGLERAREKSDKIITAALVGNTDTKVANAAEVVFSAEIPELGRSPGIRSYSASLMGLMSLAIRIGEIKRKYTQDDANAMRKEIIDMAEVVEATYEASHAPAEQAAKAVKEFQFISYAGSGPSFGSASFSGAKVVEAAGVFSVAADLEEWAHVERFAYPLEYPVFIVAPPGKGYWRAAMLAEGVKQMGHYLMVVVEEGDTDVAKHADVVFPVKGKVREAFSPLLYYIAGTTLSHYIAKELGRAMFMSDNEFIMKLREKLMRQIR